MRSKSIWDFESPPLHKNNQENLLIFNKFSFIKNYSAKTVSANITKYRGLKLVTGVRWYIEYYYEIPINLKHLYNNKEWERFRIFEGINRRKGAEKDKYAKILLDAVRFALDEEGYNPFAERENIVVRKKQPVYTANDLIDYFLANIEERHLIKGTENRYKAVARLLQDYLAQIGKSTIPANDLDEEIVQECLLYYKSKNSWSNRQYNNILGFLSIMFNFVKGKKKITDNPCDQLKKLKFASKKHKYYDDKTLSTVLAYMKKNDTVMYLMAQFVYYAGIRSGKELMGLQVGDILIDRDRLRLRSEATKGNREDYIFLDPKLKESIENSGIMSYDANCFIFSAIGHPSPTIGSQSYVQDKFRKVRESVKLGQDYTLYSFKHTRALHLLMDGAEPIDIMQLFRHGDLGTTTRYIRDLGFDMNTKFAAKSRTI